MAAPTSGFQLSTLSSAPAIPTNIGVVDTKEIYDNVANALRAHETFRTLSQQQRLADAQLQYEQQKAQTETGLLAPEADARRAKAQLFSAQVPYEQSRLGLEDRAKTAQLQADITKNTLMQNPEFVKRMMILSKTPTTAKSIQALSDIANDPNQTPQAREAAQIQMGLSQNAHQKAQAALAAGRITKVIPQEDGTLLAVTATGGTGILGYPSTYQGDLAHALEGVPRSEAPQPPIFSSTVGAAPSSSLLSTPPEEATAMPNAGVGFGATPPSGAAVGGHVPRVSTPESKAAAESARKFGPPKGLPIDRIEGDERKKAFIDYNTKRAEKATDAIALQQSHLDEWKSEAAIEQETEKTIDELIAQAEQGGIHVSGGGLIGRADRALNPGERADFDTKLQSVTQKIQLGNMLRLKNASASGATGFGNLSESEGELLRSDYGNLANKDISNESLIATLQRMKSGMASRRQAALDTIQNKILRERAVEDTSYGSFLDPETARQQTHPAHDLEKPYSSPMARTAAGASIPPAESMAPKNMALQRPKPEALAPKEETTSGGKYEKVSAATPQTPPPFRVVEPGEPKRPEGPNFSGVSVEAPPTKAPSWDTPSTPEEMETFNPETGGILRSAGDVRASRAVDALLDSGRNLLSVTRIDKPVDGETRPTSHFYDRIRALNDDPRSPKRIELLKKVIALARARGEKLPSDIAREVGELPE